SPMAIFPELDSITVSPCFNNLFSSAQSIMFLEVRDLRLFPAFRYSSLPYIEMELALLKFSNLTKGVFLIVSNKLFIIIISQLSFKLYKIYKYNLVELMPLNIIK